MNPNVFAPTYPYVHITVLLFDKKITKKNGLKNGDSNIYLELTNAAAFGKHGLVRFHWLSGVAADQFTDDDVIGDPIDLAGNGVVNEVKLLVPLELLKKSSSNGGKAGIYYEYVENDNSDPVLVGKPQNINDKSAGKSQTFDIDINGLTLLPPVPSHIAVEEADLKSGFIIRIPTFAGESTSQSITLHWKQGENDTAIGPYSVSQPEINSGKDIVVHDSMLKSLIEGDVELYYEVSDSGQLYKSDSAHVTYGKSVKIVLPAPVFSQAKNGEIDVSILSTIEVSIPSESEAKNLQDVTLTLEGLDAKGSVITKAQKIQSGTVSLPTQFIFDKFSQENINSFRASYVTVSNKETLNSPATTVLSSHNNLSDSESGYLYGAGWHGVDDLGSEDRDYYQRDLEELTPRLKVKFLPHGSGRYTHSVVGADGLVYSWGANDYSETGTGLQGRVSRHQAIAPPGISFISNGSFHTLALDADGTLYVCGCTNDGRLTLPSAPNARVGIFTPALTAMKFSFVSASGTGGGDWDSYSAMGISKGDGKLYGWGFADTGVLGGGVNSVRSSQPVLVEASRSWKWVSHNNHRAAGITTEGELYTWGNEDGHGVLGRGVRGNHINLPELLNVIDDDNKPVHFTKVSTGQHFMLALDTKGRVWGWGSNWCYALGRAGRQDENGIPPVLIPGLHGKFIDIATDWASGAAINSDGTLYTWGNNQRGQLGLGINQNYVGEPTSVPLMGKYAKRVSFGCFALFVLLSDSNEHG